MTKVDPLVIKFAVAALAEAALDPFPKDSDGRRVWWEATQGTVDDLATLIPAGLDYPAPAGVQPMLLGYPVHAAPHVEPGYLALCEQLAGIGLAMRSLDELGEVAG